MKPLNGKGLVAFFWLLLALFSIPFTFKQILDVDIWWHLQIGRSLVEERGIPDLTTYYFSPVNQRTPDLRYTWLGDLFFYLVHQALGDFGLQLLVFALVLLTAWLLLSAARARANPWTLLLLCFLVAGTYQLQTVRNALFSMPLLALMLWLWARVRLDGRAVYLWWFPVILTVWSFLHGSYLLGFGALVILILGDFFDWLRGLEGKAKFPLSLTFLILGLSFLGIAALNPLTAVTLRRILPGVPVYAFLLGYGVLVAVLAFREQRVQLWLERHRASTLGVTLTALALVAVIGVYRFLTPYFREDISLARVDLRAPTVMKSIEEPGGLGRIKLALNNTFWKTGDIENSSSDFLSPFDDLHEIYVWTSLLLGLVALLPFVFHKPRRCGPWLLFFSVFFLGMGYKRTVGYIAVMAVFLLLAFPPRSVPAFFRMKAPPAILAAGLLGLVYASIFWSFPIGLWENHHLAIGRAPYYSDACSRRILEKHPEKRVFTNIQNGGYLLYRWFPEKRVYLDGFFAPHRGRTFNLYYKVLLEQNPDLLFRGEGIDMAIIALPDSKWISLFSKSENWYPMYMDLGMMVYAYQPKFNAPVPEPDLLFTAEEVWRLPSYYRKFVANRIFEMASGYIVKGRLVEAQRYLEKRESLMNEMNAFATDGAQEKMRQNFMIVENRYTEGNAKLVRYEFLYWEYMQNGMQDQMILYGHKILEQEPDRHDILLALARAKLNKGNLEEAESMLAQLEAAKLNQPEFWQAQKSTIAEAWLQASRLAKGKEDFIKSYSLLRTAAAVDAARIPQTFVLQQGMALYDILSNRFRLEDALYLLKIMETHFPESGLVAHAIAWHLLEFNQQLKSDLQVAENYALKAVAMMKTSNHPDLNLSYLNLSKIYSMLGETDKSAYYKEKAQELAPSQQGFGVRPRLTQ